MRYLSLFILLSLLSPVSAFQPHPITSYPVVGYKEFSFKDQPSGQERTMLLWYPVDPQIKGTPSSNIWDLFNIALDAPMLTPRVKKPLIVISHGFGGSPHGLSWLINKLVYNNCIVIGIQHLDLIEGKPQINIWHRAQDIISLLDQFESQSFAKFADLNQIGFAGFSMGGTTGIWLAGGESTRLNNFIPSKKEANFEGVNAIKEALPTLDKEKMMQSWKESRIKAAFLMAPAWGWIFDKRSLNKITIPTFIVASNADNILVTKNNARFFSKNIRDTHYQEIPGQASHYIFLSIPREKAKLPANLQYLITDPPTVDRWWIQFELANEACMFFQSSFSNE